MEPDDSSKQDKLVRRKPEINRTERRFLTPSERVLSLEILLTAQNSKTVIQKELSDEFAKVFAGEPEEAIGWAFKTWRDRSAFFPAISELRELIAEWKRGEREQQELRKALKEKLTLAEAREAGQLVSYAEVVQKLAEIAKFPEPAPEKTRTVSIRKLPPPVPFTRQQIEERKQAERAEIERERKRMEGA